jgi:hypothetical protein
VGLRQSRIHSSARCGGREEGALDDYAARNHAEFFAVATEAFFCSSDNLRARLPDLYAQLERLYCRPLA